MPNSYQIKSQTLEGFIEKIKDFYARQQSVDIYVATLEEPDDTRPANFDDQLDQLLAAIKPKKISRPLAELLDEARNERDAQLLSRSSS